MVVSKYFRLLCFIPRLLNISEPSILEIERKPFKILSWLVLPETSRYRLCMFRELHQKTQNHISNMSEAFWGPIPIKVQCWWVLAKFGSKNRWRMDVYLSIHLSVYLSFCDHVYVDTNVHTTIQFNTIYVCVSYTCLVFYGVFTPKPLNRFRRMGDSVGHAAGLKSGSFRKLGKHTQNSTFCGLLYVFHCNANGCWAFFRGMCTSHPDWRSRCEPHILEIHC
jgi:hypothetical protein